MKITLLLAFMLSLLTFLKDLLKGFKNNKIDIYFDVFFVVVTLIPFLFHLIMFLREDVPHWKIFKFKLIKFALFDYGERWSMKNMEKGKSIFCNQMKETPEVEETENLTCFMTFEEVYELSKSRSDLELNELKEDDLYATIEKLDPIYLGIDYEEQANALLKIKNCELFEIGDDISKFSGYRSEEGCITMNYLDISGQKLTKYYEMSHTMNHYNKFIHLFHINNFYKKEIYNFFVGDLNIRFDFENSLLKVKHKCNSIDSGVTLPLTVKDDRKMFLLLLVLNIWKTIPNIGISDFSTVLNFKKLRNGKAFVGHCLKISEIANFIWEERKLFIVSFQFSSKISVQSSFEIVSVHDNETMYPDKICNESQIVETIDKVVKEEKYFNVMRFRLSEKYGLELTDFILNYTIDFFKSLNLNAIDFLITKSSCWKYRNISTNWKSKRYLCDINYIFEVAGVPRLTHIDRKLKPTRKIIEMRSEIPKCKVLVERKVLSYDLDQVKNECGKNSKNFKTVVRHKKIISSCGLEKFPAGCNMKLIKQKFEKVVTETNDIYYRKQEKNMPKSSEIKVQNHVMDFKNALLSNTKNIKGLKEKITKKWIHAKKVKTINEVKEILPKLEKIKNKKIKHMGKFQILKDKSSELELNNYYGVLNKYIDEIESEETAEFTEDDLKTLCHHLKNEFLGLCQVKKSTSVLKAFLLEKFSKEKWMFEVFFPSLLTGCFASMSSDILLNLIVSKVFLPKSEKTLNIKYLYQNELRKRMTADSNFSKTHKKNLKKMIIKRKKTIAEKKSKRSFSVGNALKTLKRKLDIEIDNEKTSLHQTIQKKLRVSVFDKDELRRWLVKQNELREVLKNIENKNMEKLKLEKELKTFEAEKENSKKKAEDEERNLKNQKDAEKKVFKLSEKNKKAEKAKLSLEFKNEMKTVYKNKIDLLKISTGEDISNFEKNVEMVHYNKNGYTSFEKVEKYENEEERDRLNSRSLKLVESIEHIGKLPYIINNFLFSTDGDMLCSKNLKSDELYKILIKKSVKFSLIEFD